MIKTRSTQHFTFPMLGALILLTVALSANQIPTAKADDAISKLSAEDQQALKVGRQVLAVGQAIKKSDLEPIYQAGTITANYVWVRGWLNEELRTAQHMLTVRKGKARDDLQKKVAFLKRAIRAIDLE